MYRAYCHALALRDAVTLPVSRGFITKGMRLLESHLCIRKDLMDSIIKKLPIPAAGVALGFAALGNLLAPYGEIIRVLCGTVSLCLIALLVAKLVLYPSMICKDMQNSIFASVSATFFMTLMQLAGYLAPTAGVPAFVLWWVAVIGHVTLMVWFSAKYLGNFKLSEVFPTYFICYVGIIVASVTSPIFGMQSVGTVLFWFGFVAYGAMFALITLRYLKHEIPEPVRPLFCIYSAPMSLSIAGYLAVTEDPNVVFVSVLAVLAQVLFVVVLTQLPKFIAGGFYPSFAAMTFPFVITATALGKVVSIWAAQGASPVFIEWLNVLVGIETIFATAMVLFVLGHYVRFLASALKPAPAVSAAPAAEPVVEVLSAD